jgi:formylglycine-generating enzyme required for sulfatase activity
MTPPIAALALALVTVSACSPAVSRRPPSIAPPPSAASAPGAKATPDPSILVLTHSWSGRTAIVGRAWADMLGARFVRFGDAPEEYPSAGAASPTLKEIRPALQHGVRRIYLGFPIWSHEPAPPIWQAISRLDLSGIEVVPFLTYLHDVEAGAVAKLEKRLRSMGAKVLARIEMRVPVSMSEGHLERRAQQALLGRPDLWSSEPAPVAHCSAASAPAGHTMCRVPRGKVWLGDDGSDESPPGSVPPRRMTVAAFDIDRTEVTVAQYARCAQAGGCVAIEQPDPCSDLADGDDKPIACVSVDTARAYCNWAGLRLPNEAEWTRAARGERATPYPWGFSPPGASGVVRGNFGEKRGAGMEGYSLVEPAQDWPTDGIARLASGCSWPDGNSPFGLCDLAGNIGEWVEPVSGDAYPMFKGGTWMDPDAWTFRIASRGRVSLDHEVTSMGFYLTGFRCARDALP